MASFRGLFRRLPSWLKDGDGGLALYAAGAVIDAIADSFRLGLYARFPEYAPADASVHFERDRKIIHWRFVAERPDGYDVWSIFGAGDQALVTLGEAADVEGLKVQLTSSANSIPWHHWIEWAKNADA